MDPLARFFRYKLHIFWPQKCHQNTFLIHYLCVVVSSCSSPAFFLLVGCRFCRIRSHLRISAILLLHSRWIIWIETLLEGVKQIKKIVKFHCKLLTSLLNDKFSSHTRFLTQFESFLGKHLLEVIIRVFLMIVALTFRAKNSLSIFAVFYCCGEMTRPHQICRMDCLFGNCISRFEQVISNGGHMNLRPQQNCILAQHQSEFVHARCRQSRHENGLGHVPISLSHSVSFLKGTPNFSKHFRRLRGEHAHKDYVALFHDMLVVKFGNHPKFLLERTQ